MEAKEEIIDKAPQILCKNCQTSFDGKFCPSCGQSVFEYERPFRFLIADFTGNLFAFDTRFWTSLKALTLQPGKQTRNFIQGKRARYMPPFRFFIFVSFLFFLIFSSYLGKTVVVSDENKKEVYQAFKQQLDSVQDIKIVSGIKDSVMLTAPKIAVPISDSSQTNGSPRLLNLSFNNDNSDAPLQLDVNEEEVSAEDSDKIEKLKAAVITVMENPKIYMNSFIKFLSWSMFLLMPVYAFILWLFFRKTAPYYYSHLIMAVNQHSFWFLIGTFVFIFQYFLPERDYEIEMWLLFLLPIHTFLGYKQLYNRSWLRTFSKSLGIIFLYSISMILAVAVIFNFWVQSEFL